MATVQITATNFGATLKKGGIVKVLTDLVDQARKVDMEKVRRETAKNQAAPRAATG